MAAFQVTKENFDRLVTESSGVVMLDFWSSGAARACDDADGGTPCC